SCMNNIHQIGIGIHLYAVENRDAVPCFASGGRWSWDLKKLTANSVLSGNPETNTPPAGRRKILYCPGVTADVKADNDQLWNRGENVIIGYTWLGFRTDWNPDGIHDGGGAVKLLAPASLNLLAEPQRQFIRKTTQIAPGMNFASTELVADV